METQILRRLALAFLILPYRWIELVIYSAGWYENRLPISWVYISLCALSIGAISVGLMYCARLKSSNDLVAFPVVVIIVSFVFMAFAHKIALESVGIGKFILANLYDSLLWAGAAVLACLTAYVAEQLFLKRAN